MRRRQRLYIDPLIFPPEPEDLSGGGGSPTSPVVEDTTFNVTSSAVQDMDVDPPAGLADGHLWVIVIGTDSAETFTTPTGWSAGAATDGAGADQPSAAVFYKTAGASEVAVNIEWGSIEQAAAYSLAISGGIYDDSTFDNISTNGTDIDSPAITVAEDGSLVFEFAIGDDNNPGTITWSTVPSGTDAGEGLIRSGSSGGVIVEGIYNQQDSGAATVGSWVLSGTRPRSTISLSISPA